MVEEGAAENLVGDAGQANPSAPEQDAAEPNDDAIAKVRALVATSAARLARRLGRAGTIGDNDIALIAEALAVPLERAAAWADASINVAMTEAELTESLITLGMTP